MQGILQQKWHGATPSDQDMSSKMMARHQPAAATRNRDLLVEMPTQPPLSPSLPVCPPTCAAIELITPLWPRLHKVALDFYFVRKDWQASKKAVK